MTLSKTLLERLQFLDRLIIKESHYLAETRERLASEDLSPVKLKQLESMPHLSERIDAFVSRFGRLQDTLGDKLLPALLTALGEKPTALIDNLERAARLELIPDADQWLAIRQLRNRMIHEYIEDSEALADALMSGQSYVPVLLDVVDRMHAELARRNWL